MRFRPGVPAQAIASSHAAIGAKPIKEFETVPGLQLVKLPRGLDVQRAIQYYLRNPNVLYSETNYVVEAVRTPNDPRFGELWGLHNTGQAGGSPDADIDSPEAWDITTGSNSFIVAVIDTGIDYNHQELSANMFRNTTDCNNNGRDGDGNGFIDDCFGIDTINNDPNPMDDHSSG